MIETTYTPQEVIPEILRTLQIFKPDNNLIEIRSPKNGSKSGYFYDHNLLINSISWHLYDVWYFVMNDITPDCCNLEQRDNIVKYTKKTTSDKDIINRDWVLIDCDPVRPSNTSASDDEKQSAWKTLNKVYEYLRSAGFSEPVICDSGNGYHLMYKADMPNTPETTELIKQFLETLDLLFSDEKVSVDKVVYNASRITKLYGTWARKGEDTPDRPHRQSYIMQAPETIQATDIKLIQSVTKRIPKNNNAQKFDVREFIRKHAIGVHKEVSSGSYTKFVLDECPFNAEHKSPDSAIFLMNDGSIGFHCFHNSCGDKQWKDVRLMFEPDAYDKKQKPKSKDKEDLYEREYIFQNRVSIPLLTKYFQENQKYLLVQGDETTESSIYLYRNGYYKYTTANEIKGLIKSLIPLPLWSKKIIDEVYGLLLADYDNFTPTEKLNGDENIINFKNGILHLDTMKLTPHTPGVLSTIQIACNYNPNAYVPHGSHFENFIEYFTNGDISKRKFLLQYMGVALSNLHGYRMKKALFMVGEGDTGKSQLKELCVRLIGERNTSGVDLQTLEERFGTSAVFNKRIVGSNDMSYVSVSELRLFKLLTGGDSINVEFKGKSHFTYKFKGVLWFCCNELPKFGGDRGDHVYARIIPYTCGNVVPEDMRDPLLLDKMFNEREYIIKLCVEGLKQVIANNYKYDLPDEIVGLTNKYRIENNTVLQFYHECCTLRKDGKINDVVTQNKVYQVYKKWSQDNNNGFSEKKDSFRKSLDEHGAGAIRNLDGYTYYRDFTLTDDTYKTYHYLL